MSNVKFLYVTEFVHICDEDDASDYLYDDFLGIGTFADQNTERTKSYLTEEFIVVLDLG